MASIRKVSFLSKGIQIVADLYLPSSAPGCPDRKKSAVIVGHQGTGVKEQASGLYAATLAAQGFVALAFDAAYQGESEGQPRGLEDPYQRVEDFKCAVTFLCNLEDNLVDPDRIGVVGICASAGYGTSAAVTDPRIKAVAGVSPMCFGTLVRDGMRDSDGVINPDHLNKLLADAAKHRLEEAKGNPPSIHNILDVFADPREDIKGYYTKWKHPRCTNKMVTRSAELLATFDAFEYIEWISPRPVLMIAGSEAMTFQYSQPIIDRAKEPKELVVLEGKGHVDLYEDVTESGPKLISFMQRYLCT
ncbi:related to hydrolases of the alpha/beta superfamily [Fusarium oxysporum]|uniref:Related to hydrolases of the alpha/beta superfamily n=1 Tax=Fusarium oxysporum TaxID=5507 RepID=A0A2H3T2B8_FUSOX|nr:related to hydrolases of the alpha/beta superfamily [Fusarium oxysporum]